MIPIREANMNNNTFVHKYIKPLIKDKTCVDMTLGNGNDTLFMAKHSKKVYGFDISKQAISNSSERLKDLDNVILIHDNHINFDKYINEQVDMFIFNLGYLPHSDLSSVTKADETLIAFDKAYKYLHKGAYIVITFYIGHIGGKDEYYLLESYIKENRLPVLETYRQNKIDSPITYIIRKD